MFISLIDLSVQCLYICIITKQKSKVMKKGACRIIGEKNNDHHFLENEIDLKNFKTKNETLNFLIFGNDPNKKKKDVKY